MKKNLVIVRAGDKSLHPHWLNPKIERNWDLAVSYFGDKQHPYNEDEYDYIDHCKGSKWQGIDHFSKQYASIIDQYDYIWLPDDDLFTTCENINAFFEHCAQHTLHIAQPALQVSSYISHHITLQHAFCTFRRTNFVEVMAPCFSKALIKQVNHSFSINSSGWGLEWLWLDIAKKHNLNKLAIIDATPVFHTRPVSKGKNGGATNIPEDEMARLFEDYGVKRIKMRNLSFYPSRFGITQLLSTFHHLIIRLIYWTYKNKSETDQATR